MRYPVTIEPDTVNFDVSSPDFPELHSCGETVEEARRQAMDALITVISLYIDGRRPIPAPGKASKSDVLVTLPAQVAIKAQLHNAMLEQGKRKADMCRALNVKPPVVDRLLDVLHASRIESLEDAAAVLGLEIDARLVKVSGPA